MKFIKNYLPNIIEINTKENLLELLNMYNSILSKETMEYLNYLIQLEIPITYDSGIKNIDRLMELEIFRMVVVYSVTRRILNLINIDNNELCIDKNYNGLRISTKSGLEVFKFDYKILKSNLNGIDITKIGDIELFKILKIENQEKLNEIMQKLVKLYNEKCPYDEVKKTLSSQSLWELEHKIEIDKFEKFLKNIQNSKLYNSELLNINKLYYMILSDFHLNDSDFIDGFNYDNLSSTKKTTKKVLTININSNTSYMRNV